MKIVVLGAYGYTGKLVCDVLTDLGIVYAVAGKDEKKLKELGQEQCEVLDILNEDEVKSLLDKFDVFVNCIGPFSEYANVILHQIVQAGKTYLDITGESVFVQNSYVKYHQLAKENQALILHSCAFESVLADLMGARLEMKDIVSIHSYYLLGKAKPSPGTRLTMKLSKFSRPYFYANGLKKSITEIDVQDVDNEQFVGFVGLPYPLPEICFFFFFLTAQNIGSYLLIDESEAKYLGSKLVSTPSKSEVLDTFSARQPKGPKLDQRQKQRFTLIVEAEALDVTKRISLRGADMYGMTAQIVGYFVQNILDKPQRFGVLSPSQFLGQNHDFFEVLELKLMIN